MRQCAEHLASECWRRKETFQGTPEALEVLTPRRLKANCYSNSSNDSFGVHVLNELSSESHRSNLHSLQPRKKLKIAKRQTLRYVRRGPFQPEKICFESPGFPKKFIMPPVPSLRNKAKWRRQQESMHGMARMLIYANPFSSAGRGIGNALQMCILVLWLHYV